MNCTPGQAVIATTTFLNGVVDENDMIIYDPEFVCDSNNPSTGSATLDCPLGFFYIQYNFSGSAGDIWKFKVIKA